MLSAGQKQASGIIEVRSHGVRLFSDDQLFFYFSGSRGETIPLDSIQSGVIRILKALGEHGYFFARMDSIGIEETRRGIILDLYLTEGDVLRVRSVKIKGNRRFPGSRLLSWMGIKQGSNWERNKIQKGLERIEEEYADAGFPFCRADVADSLVFSIADIQSAGAPLIISVDEGKECRIDSILFEGAAYTRFSVLSRQTGLLFGKSVNKRELDAAERNLNRLPFLDFVSPPQWVLLPGDKTGILFEIKEGSPNHFSGILGYLPSQSRGSTGGGVVTGDITVHFGNIFGTGRSVTGRWARRDQVSQDFDFRYHEPWVLGSPVHLNVFFGQAIQDSSYLRRGAGIEAQYILKQSFSVNASIEKFTTNPEDYGVETYRLCKYSSIEGSVGISYDSRDYPVNPRKGMYHHLALKIAQRRGGVESEGETDTGKVYDRSVITDFIYTFPVTYKQAVYFQFHGAQMNSGRREIPYSQWFAMGGARSLRGYRELQFRSTSIGWWNLEYRFLPERRSRFFVFFDGGFYKTTSETDSRWKRKYGYGAGFRVNSRLGIIGMDYGIGEEGGFSSGKIHLSIENKF